MESFVFEYATKVYFGKGTAKEYLAKALSTYGRNVMLAYGGGSIKQNGVYEELTVILKDAGKTVTEFSGIMPNPTYTKVQEGAALAKKEKIDFILAVGGGSVIDCCKIIAAQAMMDEDLWEMEMERHQLPSVQPLPMGAIVTASGTGAEMNGGAVITNEEKKIKTGLFSAPPRFAILDPEYTKSVPPMQVFSGAFDTLSHAMETYFGRSDMDNVSDDVALAIMRNTVVNMRRLLTDINDMQARGNLMWDSAMAENGILKVGRVTDFQAHQIEHQLGAFTDCNHGQGLAVIHPAYYRHIVKNAEEKFTRFAKIVFNVDNAKAGIDALADFIRECGLPTKMGQLKSKVEISPEVLRKVADTCNIIKCNPRELSRDEIYEILMECM
ncbi:iron-containing alcohol dehydrogenase [Petrotoga olearia]|uniref:NADH-dependent butanol dehydrogenase n=2 Tax=Petrotoga olearia TaxID=156203 RepID=A0A2K1P5D8_9BACT|nr:iron-containing alcohol dehydrogenase [Petrotoga olearia]PNR98008.1 NADH-dependent butanol dehydrogenase [Petrotoga olearia DSM 13574]RMA75592.1 alcohol dehydrogenase YqhD (iron-dependent ADH family) [Petrotoga olearia]